MSRVIPPTIFLCALSSPLMATVEVHSLLVSGFQAPGAPAGVSFSYFDQAYINNSGQVSFSGSLSNGREGIWSTGNGMLEAVAIEGTPAPGTPVRNYSTMLLGGLGDNGKTAFTAQLTGQPSAIGAFSGAAGSIQNLARKGSAVPNLPAGSFFTSVSQPQFGNLWSSPGISGSGAIAFYAGTYDPGTFEESYGIWSDRSGTLVPVAQLGQAASGYPAGSTIGSMGVSPFSLLPKMNDLGDVAFAAMVSGPGVEPNERSVYIEQQGTFNAVARTSSVVPGADGSTRFSFFNDPGINNQRHVTINATLSGPTVTPANDSGIWSTSGGSLHKVAREGDSAPGAAPGVIFSGFDGRTEIGGMDQVLVHGFLSGPGIDPTKDSGLWMERSGILELVFQKGMQAPGFDPGIVFGGPDTGISGFATNSNGYLVFRHRFGSTDGSISGDAIFTTNPLGNIELVVHTGQVVEALPGQFKTIGSLAIFGFADYTGGQDGGSPFNDAGQLAFPVTYTDGSKGILVATVPEPAVVAMLCFAVMCAFQKPMKRGSLDSSCPTA